MRRAGNVVGLGEKKSTYRDLVDKSEGQRTLERLGLDGKLMLIRVLKQQFCQLVSHSVSQPFNLPIG
jgi:hypothetical protein